MVALDPTQIRMAEVPCDDLQIQHWFTRAKARWPASSFVEAQPEKWLGMYQGDRLLSAYGGFIGTDGTVVVSAAVCEPSKRGLTALGLLGIMLKGITEKRRVVFMVDTSNRRMQFIARQILGAQPIAEIMEIPNGRK